MYRRSNGVGHRSESKSLVANQISLATCVAPEKPQEIAETNRRRLASAAIDQGSHCEQLLVEPGHHLDAQALSHEGKLAQTLGDSAQNPICSLDQVVESTKAHGFDAYVWASNRKRDLDSQRLSGPGQDTWRTDHQTELARTTREQPLCERLRFVPATALRYNRIAAGVRAIVEQDFAGLFAITGYGQTLA